MNVAESLRDLRRTLFESIGSSRFSRPALHDLDAKLAKYLPNRAGFFVEAGANDGYTFSNTYYLERIRGWQGILIEGIPELFEKARRRRPAARTFNCALVPPSGEGIPVQMIYGNMMSLVVGAMGSAEADAAHIANARQYDPTSGSYSVNVPGRCLSSVLDECQVTQIDFLSLDVEGFEVPALQGLDFKRHRPLLICVEARQRADIEALLKPYYNLVTQLTEMDLLFKAKS